MGLRSEVGESIQGESFARLAGHARVLGAAGTLVVKLGLVGAAGIPWTILADEMRFGVPNAIRPTIAAIAFMTGLVWMCVTAHWRRWQWMAALVGVGASFGVFAAWGWYLRTGYYYPSGPSVQILCKLSAPAAIGGCVAGILAWMLCRWAFARIGVSGAFAGALPAFGTPEDGGYRPALDALLLRAERGYASLLLCVRSLTLCGVFLLVSMMSWSWIRSLAYQRYRMDLLGMRDMAAWLALGVIIGAVLGVILMPAGRLRSALAVGLVLLGAGGIGAIWKFLSEQGALSGSAITAAIVFASSAVAGAISAVFAQFVAGFFIRAVMPVPIQRHLLGDACAKSPAAASGGGSAECCEECGYHLDGLPTITCEGCGTVEVRCPECGHCQQAGTLHARVIHRLFRWHTGVRAGSCVLALGVGLLMLIPWYFLGVEASRGLFGSSMALREWFAILLIALLLIAPLRFMLLHVRPSLAGMLLTVALPTIAATLGVSMSRSVGRAAYEVYGMLLPVWTIAAALVPILWRGWLQLMLPRSAAAQAYAWQISRGLRWSIRNGEGAPSEHVGREARSICKGCGVNTDGSKTAACAQCGVMLVGCAACPARTPISKVRAVFESMVYRARSMLLVQVCATALIACVVSGLLMMGNTYGVYSRIMYPPTNDVSVWARLGDGWIVVAMTGAIVGIVFMNRGKALAAVCALVHFVLFALIPACVMRGDTASLWQYPALATVLSGLLAAIAFIAALLGPMVLDIASRAMLSRRSAAALLSWLNGRNSLDDAGASLSAEA